MPAASLSKSVFISHASADDEFVKDLREKLESHRINVWVDSRNLRGGDRLNPAIEQAIRDAAHVLAVLSPNTINSPWVRKEIRLAEQTAKIQADYRVIPLLLPGIEPAALSSWFDEEPVGVKIQLAPGQLQEALPRILAALGQRLPDDIQPADEPEAQPVAELLLELRSPKLTQLDNGAFQLSAEAELIHTPADTQLQPEVSSKRFRFVSPVGQIEQDRLRWYLEDYYRWPAGLFQQRAAAIEADLPRWGQALYQAVLGKEQAREAVSGWQQARAEADRRFSVRVDASLLDDAPADEQANARTAASRLISLPWELLRDDKAYLSEGANPVRVRRRLPNYANQIPRPAALPIRILLASPRPEQEGVGYLDHRASAKPLVAAAASLGDLAELHVLNPPTLAALEQELKRAHDKKQPYHVLHFDGHGVYDPEHGLGALCFEDPQDSDKLENRRMALVHADKLAGLLRDYRIPLVFLEACQTAQSEADPSASVAARLLEAGVSSVVAMSHSVLVETARRFTTAFYQSLAQGQRIGLAMLAGQTELMRDSHRLNIQGAGGLSLHDWFVPILYQEQHDPQLFTRLPSARALDVQAAQRQAMLGELPDPPKHEFVGRSRELLKLERLLQRQPYAVIAGVGGEGKTTLAVELARWLVASNRFDRCAFVSLEQYSEPRTVVDALGRQLLPNYTVAEYGEDLEKALQPIRRELANHRCLLVLDNMETLLAAGTAVEALLGLFASLRDNIASSDVIPALPVGKTRLLLTTREPLPEPFNHRHRQVTLGQLSAADAIELVTQVMRQQGLDMKPDETGNTPEAVTALVEAVNRHARALVLLAQELSVQGVKATTANVRQIMRELDARHPGQRELSLFASVELSLRRLPPTSRERVKGLAVFHDGADAVVLSEVLALEFEQAQALLAELVAVGLAQEQAYTYHRLDPALCPYLSLSLTTDEAALYRPRWRQAMSALVDFLYQQRSQDAKLAARLTQWELPNLLAFIQQLAESVDAVGAPHGRDESCLGDDRSRPLEAPTQPPTDPAELVAKAGRIEQLLENLHRPQALALVVGLRQQAARQLGAWSHVRFQHERLSIERLLQQNAVPQAFESAQALLRQCQQAGEQAYPDADYDLAMAINLLGQVLFAGGAAEPALTLFQQAQQRFESLGERGARMTSVTLTQQGDCLRALGRLDAAAAVYEEDIWRAEKREDTRQVAVAKGQLAWVRLDQKRYADALEGYQDALALFSQLDEPGSVATIWHQIGMAHRQSGHYPPAEQAYRQSLSIEVQQGNRAGEAGSLNEFGNLYSDWQRPEQAVAFYRQAADVYAQLGDKRYEGVARGNLANVLIQLGHYELARPELRRALECKQPYGHAAEPWKTWNILHDLELASGNPEAAQAARQQALQAYLAYRRDGGENHSGAGRLVEDVWQALRQADAAAVSQLQQVIAQLLQRPDGQEHLAFLHALQALLAGSREPGWAEDASLHYSTAAELAFLLERLPAAETDAVSQAKPALSPPSHPKPRGWFSRWFRR